MAIDLQGIMNRYSAASLPARNFGSQMKAEGNLMDDLYGAADTFHSDLMNSIVPGAQVNPNLTISLWARICLAIGFAKDRIAALIKREQDNRMLNKMTHELAFAAKG